MQLTWENFSQRVDCIKIIKLYTVNICTLYRNVPNAGDKLDLKGGGKEPCFIAFANFFAVNIHIINDLKMV